MLIAKSMVIDYTTSQFTPTDYTTPSRNLRMICVDVMYLRHCVWYTMM